MNEKSHAHTISIHITVSVVLLSENYIDNRYRSGVSKKRMQLTTDILFGGLVKKL